MNYDICHGSIVTFVTCGAKNASAILIDINEKKDIFLFVETRVRIRGF
jgi:hypothetical protein